MKKLIIILVVLGLAVVGCSKGTEGGKPGEKKEVKFSNPNVIAKIGSTEIKDTDLDAILSQIPEPYRARYATPEAKREIIEKMAEVKMMAMEAKKKGIDKKPATKLKLEYIGDQILARDLEESAVENIKVNDADIAKYYNDNKDKFAQGPRVKVRHILVPTEPEAKAILAELKKGADFSKLANVQEFASLDTGISFVSLIKQSHVHLFGIAFIFMLMGAIFLLAVGIPEWIKATLVMIPFAFLIIDVIS